MSSEANKAVVEWFFAEVFNEQRQEKADAVPALHFVAHHPTFPKGIRSPGGLMQTVAMFRAGFAILHYAPEDLLAEGDKAVARWRASVSGTHQGVFSNVPPSGNLLISTKECSA